MTLASRVKIGLEVAAILVGLALGVLSLWQQLKPSRDLVAEVLVTPARMPPEIAKALNELPEHVIAALLEADWGRKNITSESARDEFSKAITATLGRYKKYADPDASRLMNESLLVCTVTNEGKTTLSSVQVAIKYLRAPVFVAGPDGSEKLIDTNGTVELGDLRPQATVQVFAWGVSFLGSSPGDVVVSHKDGLGEVRLFRPVPYIISAYGGVYFSWQQTTYVLIGVLLTVFGTIGLMRFRAQRMQDRRNSAAS